MQTITWTRYCYCNLLLLLFFKAMKIYLTLLENPPFNIQVLVLVREQIVLQGLDRIQLPDGDFSFTYGD